MAKSKQKKKLKTNSFHGTPGSGDFDCKLPKHITLCSINTALLHVLKCDIENAVLDEEQHLTGEQQIIYPNLNEEIARHYCILAIRNGRHDTQGTGHNSTKSCLSDNSPFNGSFHYDPLSRNSIDQDVYVIDLHLDPIVVPESPDPSDIGSIISPDHSIHYLAGKVSELARDLAELKSDVAKRIREKGVKSSHSVHSEKLSQTAVRGDKSTQTPPPPPPKPPCAMRHQAKPPCALTMIREKIIQLPIRPLLSNPMLMKMSNQLSKYMHFS